VRLYYSILNTHNGYLYQFYGKNSSVTVRETTQEKAFAETAEDETVRLQTNVMYIPLRREVVCEGAPPFVLRQCQCQGGFRCSPVLSRRYSPSAHQRDNAEQGKTSPFTADQTEPAQTDYTMPPRAFAQVFVLCPQENGYYVRTDLAHVLSSGHNRPLLSYWQHNHSVQAPAFMLFP